VIRLTLPVCPSANDWHRVVNGRPILSKVAREYTEKATTLAQMQRCQKIASPRDIDVEIVWYRARKSGDVDKRGAVLLDALQGIAYDDDSQIRSYLIVREEDKDDPRMEVTIMEAA